MSQENVEIVRRMLIEFNRSQQLTEAWAPDFVWEVGYPGAPTTEYHGREGFSEFLEDWLTPYEEWEQELDDVLDAGANKVVAVLCQRGRVSGTENWVDLHYAALYTLEDGLIRRCRVYRSRRSPRSRRAAGVGGSHLGPPGSARNLDHRQRQSARMARDRAALRFICEWVEVVAPRASASIESNGASLALPLIAQSSTALESALGAV